MSSVVSQQFLQSSCSSPQLSSRNHPNGCVDTGSDKLKRTAPLSKLNLSASDEKAQNGEITAIEWDTSEVPVIQGSQNLGGDDIIPIDVYSTLPQPDDVNFGQNVTHSSPESTLVAGEIDQLSYQSDTTVAPEVEIQIGESPLHFHADSNITEDDESLFNELMDSTSDLSTAFGDSVPDWDVSSVPNSRNSSLSRSDSNLLRSLLSQNDPFSPPQDSLTSDATPVSIVPPREFAIEDEHVDDNSVTPKASPFTSPSTIRRWTVKRHANGDDFDMTPKASPHFARHDKIPVQKQLSRSSRELSPHIIEPPSPFREISSDGQLHVSLESPAIESKDDSSPSRKSSSSSITRRHSFGTNTKRIIVHKREGSRSTDNSPPSSPKREPKKKSKQRSPSSSGVQRRGSFNKAPPISVIGLVSTTMTDLNLVEDLPSIQVEQYRGDEERRTSIILPPPAEFVITPDQVQVVKRRRSTGNREFSPGPGSIQELDSPNSQCQKLGTPNRSRESSPKPSKDMKSIFRLPKSNRKHSKVSQEVHTPNNEQTASSAMLDDSNSNLDSPVTPYDSNPDEMMSFDEMLTCFDDFADVTGKTVRTLRLKKDDIARPHSPQPAKKKEKKKRRSQTVANIDAETMRQVNELMKAKEMQRSKESPPVVTRQRSESKVYQLAREYSQKIKNHQRNRILKRFSTVVEEPPELQGELGDPDEPSWLQDLRDKRRSRRLSQEDVLDTGLEAIATSQNLGLSRSQGHLPLSHSPLGDRKKMPRSKSSTGRKPRAHTLGRLTAEEVTSSPKANNRRFRSTTPDSERGSLNGESDSEQQRKKRFGWVRSFFNKDKGKD